jgi:hypothetical protein
MPRLVQDFGDRADSVAVCLLNCRRIGSPDYIGDRLVRCIVQAAKGNERRVQELIVLEREDVRDVIGLGEYDGSGNCVRDLRVTFLIDSPEKMWISGVADMMAS